MNDENNTIENNKKIKKETNFLLYFCLIFFFIFLIFIWFWNNNSIALSPIFNVKPWDIGDSMNIFNALVWAITIVFVRWAYQMQLQAFELQQKELEETRNVMKEQEKEMAEQRKIMQDEKLYNQLNFLLEQKEKFLNRILYNHLSTELRGVDVFQFFYFSITENYYVDGKFWKNVLPSYKIDHTRLLKIIKENLDMLGDEEIIFKIEGKEFSFYWLENFFKFFLNEKNNENLMQYKYLCEYIQNFKVDWMFDFTKTSYSEKFIFDLIDVLQKNNNYIKK